VRSVRDLREALSNAAGLSDRAERQLAIAAVITDALRALGHEPIIVGGAAVEIYTLGGYVTDDLPMVCPSGADVDKRLGELGFRRSGKDFVNDELALYVEFPSSSLGPSERSVVIESGERRVRIISREDLIIDRLNAYKSWRSGLDGVSALLLLEDADVDEAHLARRAREDDVADALAAVREAGEEIIRLKLSKKKASALLEARMRKLPRG